MALNLNQNLSQQQVLSPQMRQGLEMLQASSLELSQVIQQALVINPVLEQVSDEASLEAELPEDAEKDAETLNELADDYRESMIQDYRLTGTGNDQETRDFIYNSIVAPKTLQQHLLNQLSLAGKPLEIHLAGEMIIGYINDRGFLTESLEDICAKERLNFDHLTTARAVIQNFDPPGVGASDITESLLIQLSHKGIHSGIEIQIIENHLKLLASKRLADIAKSIGTNLQAVIDAAHVIATLRPNPGSDFDPTMNPQIQPDLIVTFDRQGKIQAHLTDAYMPKLSISDNYKDLLSTTPDSEVRKYLKENIRDGRTLIRSLGQRQETLLKIIEVLMQKQEAFFRSGPRALKPLTMNEVAEIIEVHPTTISRACTSKYVLTPVGIFELRYFFTTAVENADGKSISNTSIRDTIKEIIETEDVTKPFTDSKIEVLLKERDIKVARRTIAKYREQLGILPSSMRRQF